MPRRKKPIDRKPLDVEVITVTAAKKFYSVLFGNVIAGQPLRMTRQRAAEMQRSGLIDPGTGDASENDYTVTTDE